MPGSTAGGSKQTAAPLAHRATLREQLEKAAQGILFSSESDYPLQFFTLPAGELTTLNLEDFLGRLGISAELSGEFGVPQKDWAEERPLDGFLPSIEELAEHYGTSTSDPQVIKESKRLRKLEALLKRRLRDVKVFRVGQVEIRCYIAGLVKGDIAGLVTTAIET
ncbi:MAG TPA: nuclease A inhibitor family protein [Thermoanaerobaculia bacterium]|nr:nuclease A inhibitor family protein [Thermoanaerobaculia bacterium]